MGEKRKTLDTMHLIGESGGEMGARHWRSEEEEVICRKILRTLGWNI